MWNSEKKHSDKERWVTIYPAYVNSRKTAAEGRKIAKGKCVDNPTFQEIRDVLTAAGLAVDAEANKIYPREQSKDMLYRGRVRVHLKNDDGTPANLSFQSRDVLFKYLGEMIPKLKTRQLKQSGGGDQSHAQQNVVKKNKGRKGGRR